MSDASALRTKYETKLMEQLDKLDEEVTDAKGAKTPLHDGKSRIALLAEVRQYLAESGQPKFGGKLDGGR